MNIYALPPLAVGAAAAFFGLFILSSNPRSKLIAPLSFFSLSAAWWLICSGLMYLTPERNLALLFSRLGFIGIAFLPVFSFQFIATQVSLRLPGWLFTILYATSSFAVIVAFFTKQIFQEAIHYFWGFYPVAGPLYPLFSFYLFALSALGLFLLFLNYHRAMKQARPLLARQSLLLLLAFCASLLGFIDQFKRTETPLYPIGYLAIMLFIGIVIYATVRVKAVDVPLNFRFSPHRRRPNYQQIISKYITALAKPEVDLDRFCRLAPYLLTKELFLSAASTMVLDREKQTYIVRAGEREAADTVGIEIAEDSPLIEELLARKREIVLDEVKALLKIRGKDHPAERLRLQAIINEMNKLKATLIIPSISESGHFNKTMLLSTINLGEKFHLDDFSREDIEFLTALAHQITLSIEYAFIFEELKRNQDYCIQAEKLAALGTATAGIAHELKNPFTFLYTVVHAMDKRWDDPEFKESVIKILPAEVERIKLILDGLSDYSKMQNLKPEPVQLAPVLEKVIAILGHEIKKNSVKLTKEYDSGSPITVMADKNRIVQVFMNILANALQAIGPGGGTVSIALIQDSGSDHISFKDNGPGIPPKVLKRIFDPFFTTKEAGTGLGLPITKKILEEQGGSIKIDSSEGSGTTVTVTLPAA
ncbi:MAG: hypothetical protein KKC80_07660 [Candidatus Margulisbacteria bacterium]|nr:hypothetical protein [Candidatus Margulisiibacteriota bacterium]MBU1617227.1 hypothetical protein [Candidatus Margulisiibacteriota bacterium]